MTENQEIHVTYCVIITIAFILSSFGKTFRDGHKNIFACLIIVFIALLIGTRPVVPNTDLAMYEHLFNSICKNGWDNITERFADFGKDPFFSILLFITSPFNSFKLTLTIISFISLSLTYYTCKIYTQFAGGSASLLFFCTIINFTFLNQLDNVIRIGLAFPLLLIYLHYYFSSNYKKAIIWGILAIGMHFSMLAAIIVSIIAKHLNCSLKKYYYLFFLVLMVSIVGFSLQQYAGLLGFSKAEYYSKLVESGGYRTGFRTDFAMFNTVFLVLFIWVKNNVRSEMLTYYIKMYILLSCWFFLWFKVPYSDRVGAYSWNLIPFISYLGCIKCFPFSKIKVGKCLFWGGLIMNLVIFIHIFDFL